MAASWLSIWSFAQGGGLDSFCEIADFPLASASQSCFDGGDDAWVVRGHVRGEAGARFAIFTDDELFEVPKNAGKGSGTGSSVLGGVAFEVFAHVAEDDVLGDVGRKFGVEGVLVGACNGDLREEREGDRVLGRAEGGYVFVGTGLLAGEVVGGKAEDDEASVFKLLVEGFKSRVLRCEAALGSDVHNEKDFAGEVGEGGRGAGDGGEWDRGEVRHANSLLRDRGRAGMGVTDPRDRETRLKGLECGKPVTVVRNVWIGGGALLLPGIMVGVDAVIGAGSVVTEDVGAGVTVVGNPGRVVKAG